MPNIPNELMLTPRTQVWLSRIDEADRETARLVLSSLTLVSHAEFERSLGHLIHRAAEEAKGPVALFATREWDDDEDYFIPGAENDSVGPGTDVGSEARVATIIRGMARGEPDKFLNHPNIEQMRDEGCRAILLIDDFIGSGERTLEFLASMWRSKTIRSWHSTHLIRFVIVAYSGTKAGVAKVSRARPTPLVRLVRDCPTIGDLPLPRTKKSDISGLCKKYGSKLGYSIDHLGYRNTGALLVFEHGCPDNCPLLLWAPPQIDLDWDPLFPGRSILPVEASAFPFGIQRRDPATVLIGVGQKRLSKSGALTRRGPIGLSILTVLAFLAKGIRNRAALSHATGLTVEEAGQVVERCVKWGFVTVALRITEQGYAELEYARTLNEDVEKVPERGDDSYYPFQLRGARIG